jgi:hypothetical protein
VIQVPVREQNALDGDAGLVDRRQDAVDVTARIDDQRLLRGVVPQDGAVLLEWCDRNDSAA